MEEGRIMEFDDPAVLLRDHKSKFYAVSRDSNSSNVEDGQ